MKILYGIQGTGNGHITRARALVPALRAQGTEVDVLISGRSAGEVFGAEALVAKAADLRFRKGLSFVMDHGRIRPWRTVKQLPVREFIRDVRQLDLSPYDLVLSDFEPVTAWAARRQGVASVGIGHQYAFAHDVPKQGINLPSRAVLKVFAPVDTAIGVHWQGYGAPIVPPVLEPFSPDAASTAIIDELVLVYLPFEDLDVLSAILRQFPGHRFHVYCAVSEARQQGNVCYKPFNRESFKQDLLRCSAVITGAGFELPSEAIVLGKRLLVQPLRAQFEQESNALALRLMGAALTMTEPTAVAVKALLQTAMPVPQPYPDVATAVAHWLVHEQTRPLQDLADELWQQRPSTAVSAQAGVGLEAANFAGQITLV